MTTYNYNLEKQIESMLQPGGSQVNYGYDAAGRLSTIDILGGLGSPPMLRPPPTSRAGSSPLATIQRAASSRA